MAENNAEMIETEVIAPDGSPHTLLHPSDWTDSQIEGAYHRMFPKSESPKNPTKSESETEHEAATRYGIKDPLVGLLNFGSRGAASVSNLAGSLINQLGGHAPHSEPTNFSEMLGVPKEQNWKDVLGQFAGEMFVPLKAPAAGLGKVGELIDKLPAWSKYIKAGLGNAITQGGIAATQSEENPGKAALTAGGITAPFSMLSEAVKSGNPTVRIVGKLLGAAGAGGLGYFGTKSLGVPEPAADLAALLGAAFAAKGGSTAQRVREDMLKGITPAHYPKISEMQGAASELGLTHLSPAETLGLPTLGAAQGNRGKTEGGAQAYYEAGQKRLSSEKESIENLYKEISEKPYVAASDVRGSVQSVIKRLENEREAAAEPYYTKAHTKKVAPSWVTNLEESDETIKNAIRDARTDPEYQKEGELRYKENGELKSYPKNSIKVLDYAKRQIDKKINIAIKNEDYDRVRVLTKSKNHLLDKISSVDQDYATARKIFEEHSNIIDKVKEGQIGQIANTQDTNLKYLSSRIFNPAETDPKVLRKIKGVVQADNPDAWNAMVRNEMERLMGTGKTKEVTGSNFYNQVLANDTKFNQFKIALEGNKKASQRLDNMKKIFGKLINVPTAKTAEALSRNSMNKPRASITKMMEYWEELISGGRYDKAAVELITNPKWTDKLSELGKVTDKEKLIAAFHNLLGKAGAQAIAQ